MSKKHLAFSVLATGVLSLANAQAAEDLNAMFSEGKVSGQIREFSVVRTYKRSAANDYTRTANAIGGHIKYETAELGGLSIGAALYTTNGFLNHSSVHSGTARTDRYVDMTLLGKNNESYSILGEAYLKYKRGNTAFKGGRQKLVTPMMGDDDARMMANLFEAYVLTNKDIANTTLTLGHVSKFAQGTFGRIYNHTAASSDAAKILSATAGYSYVDSLNQVGEFKNMGTYAFGESTGGVTMASATYTGIKNLKLDFWDYYAHDIMNTIYAEANYSWKCLFTDSIKPFAGIQVIKQDDVGSSVLKSQGGDGSIDSLYTALKLGAKVKSFTAYAAYSETSKNSDGDRSYKNAIITPWGGMPAYTQGMVTRHMFLAGTKASKVAASYNFKEDGVNLDASVYYTTFSMRKNNGYTHGDANESGFDLIYYPSMVKKLQVRFRGNYPRSFNVSASGAKTGWAEHRFILNYNF